MRSKGFGGLGVVGMGPSAMETQLSGLSGQNGWRSVPRATTRVTELILLTFSPGGVFFRHSFVCRITHSSRELASRQSESIKLRQWQRGVSERTAVREDVRAGSVHGFAKEKPAKAGQGPWRARVEWALGPSLANLSEGETIVKHLPRGIRPSPWMTPSDAKEKAAFDHVAGF